MNVIKFIITPKISNLLLKNKVRSSWREIKLKSVFLWCLINKTKQNQIGCINVLCNANRKSTTHRCGTSRCRASACQRLSGQIVQFDPRSIWWMKVSWQTLVCRVSPAEPHLCHPADGLESVQANGWTSVQVSGSESVETWTWGH